MKSSRLDDEIKQHGLPADFMATITRCYAPIASSLSQRAAHQNTALIVGVQGCQGSGKSTLAAFLKILLETQHNCPTAVLSIDDFYLTKQQRLHLAKEVHPLLATRGVPGTHDIDLALRVIHSLQGLAEGESFAIPRFDKSIDDRAAPETWDKVHGRQDVIILEGWCVGLDAQEDSQLADPLNDLEKAEDAERVWRDYVNLALKTSYPQLFSALQMLIVLAAPSFDCVFQWRCLQEEKLRKKIAAENTALTLQNHRGIMNNAQLRRFISHYQRLTEHGLASLPPKADWLLRLDENHTITGCEWRKDVQPSAAPESSNS